MYFKEVKVELSQSWTQCGTNTICLDSIFYYLNDTLLKLFRASFVIFLVVYEENTKYTHFIIKSKIKSYNTKDKFTIHDVVQWEMI